MKTNVQFFLLTFTAVLLWQGVEAQTNPWTYVGRINFPIADSVAARPYLCTLDNAGRLYMISSKADDAKAHNAVYYANPGDTVFKKLIDYDLNGDSDTSKGNMGALRGVTTLNRDVIVIASQPYPKTKPNTLAAAYYYKNADTNSVDRFGFNIAGSGYGTFINGVDISKDSMMVTGVDFGTSIRWYNYGYKFTKSGHGSYNSPDTNNTTVYSNATEPGGAQSSGLDLIRDVALVPGGDYYSKKTVLYTSRNSLSNLQQTGGIAVWQGGTQVQPIDYVPSRVSDFDGFLSFSSNIPYGITVDARGILWVAGVDTTRRWVKGFFVDGVNAQPLYDLPSQTSGDIQTPNGAPMSGPSDIAITQNGQYAYVADRYARCAFKFKCSILGVQRGPAAEITGFALNQNYPNPFNPSTIIKFSLSQGSDVRLVVTDMLGREVAVLVNGYRDAGQHAAAFNASTLPTGIYFYTLMTPTTHISKKMMLMK
ncbi:MAG: T9SS type A sorting domain-containing protein [Ignavibacteriales bacterium]|nr:T9SS type A sorting domain-containing protein [Ignavibacteriales bacterium]